MRFESIRRRVAPVIGVVLALFATTCVSHAQVIFAYFGGNQRTDGGIVAGNTFTTFSPQTFNSLGFIDVGDDGLVGSYQVGLWDSSQNLLASTTVTPSAPLTSGFRYASIPPTLVPAGTFTVGALLPASPADPWIDNTTLVLGAGFAGAGTGQYVSSGSLVYPTTTDSGNVYAVANASQAVVTPEPVGAVSLIMCAMAGGLLRRRRSSR
jgi:hypothetical protein